MRPSLVARRGAQRGAIAIIVAVAMSALLITGAIVLDFGVVRLNRQITKSAADNAVTAALRAGDVGTGDIYSDRAVCAALSFLRANRPALGGLPDGLCAAPNDTKTCDPSTPSSYLGSTTSGNSTFKVWIKSPYQVTDTSTDGGFGEESLSTLSGDRGGTEGCDQVGVIVKESTKPGLGRLVTSTDIVSRVRSVGRVGAEAGDQAPALLLLERTKCSVLTVGSAGSSSRIKVYGIGTTPGTIHSDSSGTGADCGSGSGKQVIQGKQAGGVVAYGAGGVSGSITSYGTLNGVGADTISDSPANAYGTTAASESVTGVTSAPTGRAQVTRKPIDVRYRGGVASAISAAASVWSLNPVTPGGVWTRVGCNPSAAQLNPATAGLYIDCPAGATITGSSNATQVFVNGWVKGGGLNFASAKNVYVNNPSGAANAIALGTGNAFCVRATGCAAGSPTADQCSTDATNSATAKAQILVRDGSLKETGGLLRLCNSTLIMMGGDTASGCVPTANGAALRTTPCAGSAGTGQMAINGGYQDWTAPNQFVSLIPTASQSAAWSGGEDLALWDESYGGSSNPTFSMAGGGNTRTVGVFMAPNADPFSLTGGGNQILNNAQYIANSFSVSGGANLTMTVDPNNAVTLPTLGPFNLVR